MPGASTAGAGERPVITCKEFVLELLYDYLDDALGPDAVAEAELHLEGCAPCRAYLATYRRTRDLAGGACREPMPDEMKTRLRQYLLDRLSRGEP